MIQFPLMFIFLLASFAVRSKAQQALFSYIPKTDVTDYAALDLDLKLIRSALSVGVESAFRVAQRVYVEGAFSRPVAELFLDDELEDDLPAGSEIVGPSYDTVSSYTVIKGITRTQSPKGTRVVEVLYDVREGDAAYSYEPCRVGANPRTHLDGCFAEEGQIEIPDKGISANFSYDILRNNINYRSFQKESLYSRRRLWDCRNCPKPDYKKYVDYYGRYDYADHVITKAFEGHETDLERGNHDFELYGRVGRREAAQNMIVYMTMWMEVISRMERSIDYCLAEKTDQDPLEYWDAAVAFYTGSRQAEDSSGVFLFHLANRRCLSASTCGEDGNNQNGTSYVNFRALQDFQTGQGQIIARNCEGARKTKEGIVRLMTIPLIQGALHNAIELDDAEDYDERQASLGAAFVAAVLPLIHACNAVDADIIHRNLGVSRHSSVDYEDVRNAFARNLQCLGITCDEVGSVLDPNSDGACFRGQKSSRPKSQANEVTVEDTSLNGVIFMYAFITISVVLICFSVHKLVSKNLTSEKEITFEETGPAQSVPPTAVLSIIAGPDYAPKYWSDCQTVENGEKPSHSLDDSVESGEIT